MWEYFEEGRSSSVKLLGQFEGELSSFYVSCKIIRSMLFILSVNSGLVVFSPKVEEFNPIIFQLLTENVAILSFNL